VFNLKFWDGLPEYDTGHRLAILSSAPRRMGGTTCSVLKVPGTYVVFSLKKKQNISPKIGGKNTIKSTVVFLSGPVALLVWTLGAVMPLFSAQSKIIPA